MNQPVAELAGRTFQTDSATGYEIVPGSTIEITFGDNRISARAGCNRMMGPASWSGETLHIDGPLASTMMAGPEELMQQDTWLANFLNSNPTLRISENSVTLLVDEVTLTLTEVTPPEN